jgi:hypothetical protein
MWPKTWGLPEEMIERRLSQADAKRLPVQLIQLCPNRGREICRAALVIRSWPSYGRRDERSRLATTKTRVAWQRCLRDDLLRTYLFPNSASRRPRKQLKEGGFEW